MTDPAVRHRDRVDARLDLPIIPPAVLILTGVRLARTLQFTGDRDFAGQGNAQWHTLYRAVLQELGGYR
ncbi:hypothetical protein [Nocardia sp. NPDC051981]|uniref:hypothetical protein n=1 Tax=Nocardia sp. NPDC051981 TaxID=3155417 RepID=UPI003449B803